MIPDFVKVDALLGKAAEAGRYALFEFEVYDLLSALGIDSAPAYVVLDGTELSLESLEKLAGEKLVLKIIHPRVIHKADVGGVEIVPRSEAVEAARRILSETPRRLAALLGERGEVPDRYLGLSTEELSSRLAEETAGVLAYPFVPAEQGFGQELFLGMRQTREFGPIITCGLGGVDTELYARELPPGRANATISVGISDEDDLLRAFEETIAHDVITGRARGHRQLVTPERLADLLARFHALVWRYSPLNPDASYWLSECEINPLVCHEGELVAVDAVLRFRPVEPPEPLGPVGKLENLLKPENICVIGVSARSINLGRVILRNVLESGFSAENLAIVKEGEREVDGVKCYPSIAGLPGKFDLVVVSVAASQVPGVISEIVENERAESIILVTSGMGEKKGGEELEAELAGVIRESRKRPDRGPVLVGGNSLGILSSPGGYDTLFVSREKLPRNRNLPLGGEIAIISQSGAFMVSRMSKLGGLVPQYAICTGNQVDLCVADFLEYLSNDERIRVFGCYAEGFKADEGLRFAEAARKLFIARKDVIVYKAGRSEEGRIWSRGHTATVAGDWHVADAVLSRAGCLVARSFTEWTHFLVLSALLAGRTVGQGRLVAISNAGFEAVGMADNVKGPDHHFALAEVTPETRSRLEGIWREYGLERIMDIRNPMDLSPMATDQTHIDVIRAFAADPSVDVILYSCVPLSHIMKTREPGGPEGGGIEERGSVPRLLTEAFKTEITKPIVVVVDSGKLYDGMAEMFFNAGIPVFRSADEAMRVFGRWVQWKALD